MSDVVTLAAEARPEAGRGGARQARREGRIPAVIYGNKEPSTLITLPAAELQKQLRQHGFLSRVFEIAVDGKKQRVLPREVQTDPVSGKPIHVDFMRFSATTRIAVEVEVVFQNEAQCAGLKLGGVLNIVQHEVELICTPGEIPEAVYVDLSGLEIGDVVHAETLKLPAGAELAGEPDATIATIAAPTVETAPAAAEETAGAETGGTTPAS
ncbi:MAG TPA: 50S ribosomal protein L25/general stress protein Ctc [Rhodospirillales bacterium]|nr:50S ribosomal protein L25/general stress protein Ctc [Rhodospirillales bacterium]